MKRLIYNKKFHYFLFVSLALFATIQAILENPGNGDSSFNNFLIFKFSFYHLINHQDLYQLYPADHFDFFKYTPTFALFFGLFAMFPSWLGLFLWNLINSIFILTGIYHLPKLSDKSKSFFAIAISVETLTNLQNEQSNGLLVALLIWAFVFAERKKMFWAVGLVIATVFIKIFGIIALVFLLFYSNRLKTVFYGVFWSVFLLVLPLFILNFSQYVSMIESYLNLLHSDHSSSFGISFMGWLKTWWGVETNTLYIQFTGLIIMLLPFFQIKKHQFLGFRYLAFSSLLISMVIFNHKAESPTFIIPMIGVGIWFFISPYSKFNLTLFIVAIIFTSFSPTDVFPPFIRNNFFVPYVIKVVPCIIIWCKVQMDLFTQDFSQYPSYKPLKT